MARRLRRRSMLAGLAGGLATGGARARDADAPMRAVPLDDPSLHVIENVRIPMRDGICLAARIFLPAQATAAPAGAVLEYLPYRKRDAYRYRDDIAGPALAARGIALIRADIRGTGDSDGVMRDEYAPPEQDDALQLIAWIARQPWCNGRVGMRGISYGSFDALQAAAKAPPALKAIVSTCGTERRYVDDIHYRGGCLLQAQFDWAMEWQVVMRSPPDPQIVGEGSWRALWQQRLQAARPVSLDWTAHQRLDAQWRYGSIENYAGLNCAIYHVAGMLDCYVDSAPRLMSQAPHLPQKALIGPWTHKWPGYPDPPGHGGPPSDAANGIPGPGVDWLPIEARWWRHWLLGEANGIMDEPRIWAFRESRAPGAVFPADTPGDWIAEARWPSPRLQPHTLHLNQDGLGLQPGPAGRRRLAACLTTGFATPATYSSGDPHSWWREQSGDDAQSLVFDGPALAAPLDVMGQPVFHIRVRADRRVAKLFARLTEVTQDGGSTLVSYAILNLTHRDSDSAPSPLVPGQDYDVRLDGCFCCHRFAAGSRIRVALSESWWPVTWPSPEPVELQVGTGVSRVELPVRPAGPADAPPFTVLRDRYRDVGLASGPYRDRLADVTVTGEPGRRSFTLQTGSSTPVETQVPAIGMVMGEAVRARRSLREDDPNSAEMEAEYINIFRRGDWNIRLRAWSLARSTVSDFLCSETLEAWEGERMVFSRRWERSIPRDLV